MNKICNLILFLLYGVVPSIAQIRVGHNAGDIEKYAALELQKYIYQLTDTKYPIVSCGEEYCFTLEISEQDDQGYSISTLFDEGGKQITKIIGNSPIGLLYGVYGFLEDHMGMRFYMSGDVYPPKKMSKTIPIVNEVRSPEMHIRGFIPWTNFPQSATVYSLKDWKFIIDQCARMRMNFIVYHNYNGMEGHNEMFQNFEYKGFLSRNWMPTIKSGHGWQCPGWNINDYQFGASEIYCDYDFGADYGLHNEMLSNRQIADKGASTFRKVIEYAHSRGVKIGLGLDIDIIPDVYKVYGAEPDDYEVIKSQVRNIKENYKELDYVLCFQSESLKDSLFYVKWKKIFTGFYDLMRQSLPDIKIAVSGWGLTAESVNALPSDVICAPIAPYSASYESGEAYGDREYWGCPWLERDFNSSGYYYPFNVPLSETIRSYKKRSKNMKGLYTLTWRLTDAVSPKLWYISKVPWYNEKELDSSRKVYWDFAEKNYGKEAAEEIIDIIDENEAYSSNFGECEVTPSFSYKGEDYYIMNVKNILISGYVTKSIPVDKFVEKKGLQIVDNCVGEKCIGFINHGSWLKYSKIDFSGVDKLSLRISSATKGGKVSIYLDNMDSEPLGIIEIKDTGGWDAWVEKIINIKNGEGLHDLYLTFSASNDFYERIETAEEQLKIVENVIDACSSTEQRSRLGYLKQRLSASLDHLILNRDFKNYKWEDFPGRLERWAKSFLYRIDDISSKGNIMSTQNRFVQLNYVKMIDSIIANQEVKAPSFTYAKGVKNGALISWRNNEPSTASFKIYRNGELLSRTSSNITSFFDRFNGHAEYRISAVSTEGKESVKSVPSICLAGNADREAPVIICISPFSSATAGQSIPLEISLLDNRAGSSMQAVVFYRKMGSNGEWKKINFVRKARSAFATEIPGKEVTTDGVEYYIIASDGSNFSRYPVSDCNRYMAISVNEKKGEYEVQVNAKAFGDGSIVWEKLPDATIYKIYRSSKSKFVPDASNYLTFVGEKSTRFKDFNVGFDGMPLKGAYFYRVVAVDKLNNKSLPSKSVKVVYK